MGGFLPAFWHFLTFLALFGEIGRILHGTATMFSTVYSGANRYEQRQWGTYAQQPAGTGMRLRPDLGDCGIVAAPAYRSFSRYLGLGLLSSYYLPF